VDVDLRQLLTSTIAVRRAQAVGRYMEGLSFGDAVEFPAYVEHKQRRLYDGAGTVVEPYSVVVLDVAAVAASAVSPITRDDFSWGGDIDFDNMDTGQKPPNAYVFRYPETPLAPPHELTGVR